MKHILTNISLFLILVLSLPSPCKAQSYSVIRQIDIEQGLSNNYVKGITQDKAGYLWFATEEGLNRYDGNSFRNYYKYSPLPLSLTGNELNCVQDDPEDDYLWIGTQQAGLNRYDYTHNTFKSYRHTSSPQSLSCDFITCICPATDGNLWLGTYNGGVDYFDKKTESFHHYNQQTVPGFPGNQIWEVADDGKGTLYIGHQGHGLTVLNLKNRKCTNYMPSNDPNSIPGNIVRSLCIDTRGQVWLATEKGLAVFNPKTKTFRRFPQIPQNCYNVRQVNDHEIWTTPEFRGIAAVNITTFETNYAQAPYIQGLYNNWLNPSEQSLRYIFKDNYNNIWLGTWGHGIFMLEHTMPLFRHYRYSAIPSEYFLNNPSVMSVATDAKGHVWIGTDGGGINVFDGNRRMNIYTQNGADVKDNCMQTALRDTKGNIWFGTYDAGLLCFNAGGHSMKQVYPLQQQQTDVRALYEDNTTGILWVATSTGIDLFNRDSHRFIRHIDLPNNLVRTIVPDGKGHLWAGTFNGGIAILAPDGKLIKTLTQANGLPSNTINQLYKDYRNNIWAGTSEGVVLFENGNYSGKKSIYTLKDGLDNTYIRSIIEDSKHRIWLSTNRSICYLQSNGRFLCYDQMDGKPLGNFTDRSAWRDEKGLLYFGSVNGLYAFEPDRLLKKETLPPAMLTGLTVFLSDHQYEQDEQEIFIQQGKDVKLNHTQNTFNITFGTYDFAFTDRVEYAYTLKGLDDAWYKAKGTHTVTFRNLPPGTYTFIVKANIPNQAIYSREASLTIDIAPPFYASWWAKTLYIIIAIGIIYWLLRFYKKRVHLEYLYASEKKRHLQEQELNKERLQFYTNITHELRTPLTLIIGPIEDVEKSSSLNTKDRHTISIIHKSALRLLSLINELLEFRKTETGNRQLRVVKGDIIQTIRETGLKYMELLRNPSVKFVMNLPVGAAEMLYDPEVITIILDNLISNAIKYTTKGSITLSAEATADGHFEIHVKDTGYGISQEALPHIFDRYYQEQSEHQASGTGIGLALVKNLVTLHEGHITATSVVGQGSCFTVTLSRNATYPNAIHHSRETDNTPDTSLTIHKDETSLQTTDSSKPASGKTLILVVEDNPDIRTYIAGTLSEDFDIRTAENGKEGLHIATDIVPDIIVSDILMPEMNGYEMCKALKTDVRTSHIPIILLTAKNSMEDKIEGYETGADSYMTKPFSATLLKSRIENLIQQRKALFSPINPLLKAGKKAMEEKRKTFEKSLNELDRTFLSKIDTLIIENLKTDKLDINFLAEELCMSSSTLYRKMKSLTGLSTKEYINRKRMQRAEELLIDGKLSVSEVAEAVGIDNPVYFRQCFKKEFGSAPSEYLKAIKDAQ